MAYQPTNQLIKDTASKSTISRWFLRSDMGRQRWEYSPSHDHSLTFQESYYLGLVNGFEEGEEKAKDSMEAMKKAVNFYIKLQSSDGHWPNDFGGPGFLLGGLAIACYITGTYLPEPYKLEIIRYLTNHQNDDGGWGVHIESESTVFGTAMNYVCLRLFGVSQNDSRLTKAREWLYLKDGIKKIPCWGKFWMALLGVYEWEGIIPIPPELWTLPESNPLHPGRWWCHTRMVFLPMAYLYGKRFICPRTKIIQELREELYNEPYEKIKWKSLKWQIDATDAYNPNNWMSKLAFNTLGIYESFHISKFRNYSLNEVLKHIRYEDSQTNYTNLGAVNKALNMIVEYVASGGTSQAFLKHQERIYDYLWLSPDGMKMQGLSGSQVWDCVFSLSALLSTQMFQELSNPIKMSHQFISKNQIIENPAGSDKFYRHISNGSWPMTTGENGWGVSDCTAEALKVIMETQHLCPENVLEKVPNERLYKAVDFILSLQNQDGGWPTYEVKRAPEFLELFNPSDSFGGIMVDYSYCECTSSCIESLCYFRKNHPSYRPNDIECAIDKAISWLKSIQRKDGSWYGSWGVCFIYGIWFAVRALMQAEGTPSENVKQACLFLLSKQNQDGSWGEDLKSCRQQEWVGLPDGHAVHTSWALMALMKAGYPEHQEAIDKGVKWLINQQLPNGDWQQQSTVGSYNFSGCLCYSGFKNIFPIWTLGMYNNQATHIS